MNIIAFLNSYSEGLSGGDACFLNNAKYFGNKAKLKIVTSMLGRDLCQKEGINASYHITSKEKRFSKVIPTYIVRTFKAFSVKFRTRKYVLYSSSDFIPDVLPPFVFKLLHSKCIWTQKVFHLIPKERSIPHIFQKISFLLFKISDLIIVDNEKLKTDLETKFGLNSRKIYVIPPGVDVSYIKSIKPDSIKYDALFLGQLRQSKGIFDIPEIWEAVIRKYPKARLAIIGKDVGGNIDQLTKILAEKNLLNNIDLLGFLTSEKSFALLKSSKCLISPSYEEGFGMVALESLVCGTPVIAYDLPAYREHFDGGLTTVKIADVHSFSNKVIDTITRAQRENYQEIYMKFDLQNLVEKEFLLIKKYYDKKSIS